MLAQHGLADAQPEACSAARAFGSKEGIKNVRQIFGRNSWTIILKHKPNRVGLAPHAPPDRAFFAALTDRLFRIQQQVEEDLHQLIGIGDDRGYVRLWQEVDRDVALAQRIGLHLYRALYEFVEIDLA